MTVGRKYAEAHKRAGIRNELRPAVSTPVLFGLEELMSGRKMRDQQLAGLFALDFKNNVPEKFLGLGLLLSG